MRSKVESNKDVFLFPPSLASSLRSFVAFRDAPGDVYTQTRSDSSLFNPAYLRTKTKIMEVLITELLFADDAAFMAHNETILQSLVNNLIRACNYIWW